MVGIGIKTKKFYWGDHYHFIGDWFCWWSKSLKDSTKFLPFHRTRFASRVEPQGIERGRTLTRISSVAKYGGAGANFRGRKSNSLMNLCGGKSKMKSSFFFYSIFSFAKFREISKVSVKSFVWVWNDFIFDTNKLASIADDWWNALKFVASAVVRFWVFAFWLDSLIFY